MTGTDVCTGRKMSLVREVWLCSSTALVLMLQKEQKKDFCLTWEHMVIEPAQTTLTKHNQRLQWFAVHLQSLKMEVQKWLVKGHYQTLFPPKLPPFDSWESILPYEQKDVNIGILLLWRWTTLTSGLSFPIGGSFDSMKVSLDNPDICGLFCGLWCFWASISRTRSIFLQLRK